MNLKWIYIIVIKTLFPDKRMEIFYEQTFSLFSLFPPLPKCLSKKFQQFYCGFVVNFIDTSELKKCFAYHSKKKKNQIEG